MHTPTVFDSNILDTFKELELSDEKLHHLKMLICIKGGKDQLIMKSIRMLNATAPL